MNAKSVIFLAMNQSQNKLKKFSNKKIVDYVSEPKQIAYEGDHESDLKRCAAGIKRIVMRYSSMSHVQRLLHAIHFYHRLCRLKGVENKDRLPRYIKRAPELVSKIQSADSRDPLPSEFIDWAKTSNLSATLGTDTEASEERHKKRGILELSKEWTSDQKNS